MAVIKGKEVPGDSAPEEILPSSELEANSPAAKTSGLKSYVVSLINFSIMFRGQKV